MLRIAIANLVLLAYTATSVAADAPQVQFNRDVRPILADNCFHCHGPDAASRQAGLRLHQRDDATADRGGYRVVDPGRPSKSELIRRVVSTDGDLRMPPAETGPALQPDEIQTLRRWIQDGAQYQPHWSFIRLRRPSPPIVKNRDWPRNPSDRFVLSRLDRENLAPSPEADASTLIRRVTLDLTGLPPTIEEIDAFEHDLSVNPDSAYGRLVDRLLASPRYGERMALAWLDAARYADTNGYFTDNDRTMWPWRDWVIDAYNANMPFDRFTIEQLAGDLLPDATVNQKIATGFNRNHMVNNESGIIEEEFRVEYVVDRVDTTASVWMGLTMGCARCHDHKYDPVTQKDFYRFFAYFNNVPERGLSGSSGNAAPFLRVPAAGRQAQLDKLRREVADAEQLFGAVETQLAEAQSEWETTAIENMPAPTHDGLVVHRTLDDELPADAKTAAVKIVDGMLGGAAEFVGGASIEIADAVEFDRTDAFTVAAWIRPKGAGCVVSKTDDADEMRGFDVTLRKGRAVVNLVHRWNSNAIQVTTASSIPSGQWRHLAVVYDGSGKARGVRIYLDGRLLPFEIGRDDLTGTIRNNQPWRIGRRQASASYSGGVDDVRLYDRRLTDDEVFKLASSQLVRGIVARPVAERSGAQKQQLREWFIKHHAAENLAAPATRLAELQSRQRRMEQNVPTTMVMQESPKPRPAFLLVGGQYDQPGEAVAAAVPEFLRTPSPQVAGVDLTAASENDRLSLAEWLVDPFHPLTARVTVNRLWQQLFGVGIVKTVDDFGTQGEWPSHPELLDWLAVELIESGWDVKHVLRLIVTSSTYRQSSHVDPVHFERDRENRLLARGPRFRMGAETLRDNALAISGLLVEKHGGPSVMPYQPAGLWEEVTYDGESGYRQSKGDSLYRRSLYTFWKRQSPPPNMLVFDAPTRETCTVERSRTNTPLQALVLMNDPTFVEASRKLAERMMSEAADDAADRAAFAFRLATARPPSENETAILLDVYRQQRSVFKKHPADALKLLSVGESSRNQSLDVSELAAWTTVASMILSLDETITKP